MLWKCEWRWPSTCMNDSRFAHDHVYDVDARILMPDTVLHDAKKNSRAGAGSGCMHRSAIALHSLP